MNDTFKMYGLARSKIKIYTLWLLCVSQIKQDGIDCKRNQQEPNIPLQLRGKTLTDLLYQSHAILKNNLRLKHRNTM